MSYNRAQAATLSKRAALANLPLARLPPLPATVRLENLREEMHEKHIQEQLRRQARHEADVRHRVHAFIKLSAGSWLQSCPASCWNSMNWPSRRR